jgi:hypothetical protein
VKQRCPSCRALETEVSIEGEIACPNPTCGHASPRALRLRADLDGPALFKCKELIDAIYAGLYDNTANKLVQSCYPARHALN